ncbi:MAG: hypothetical protein HC836_42125 [Richelia sp. RM2_1_2]|nr:hypothetical protein [Richelia sp. RM2_1_2]
MKTLVIHPKDKTTDFLTEVYTGIDCTVVRSLTVSKKLLKSLIKESDRVIFLGHGDPNGLFTYGRYIIDSSFVYLLREKTNMVYIWCHADEFMKKYGLKGVGSGMIVSDLEESYMYSSIKCSLDEIIKSNNDFASALKNAIHLPTSEMVAKIKDEYSSDTNMVINFNQQNIYFFE